MAVLVNNRNDYQQSYYEKNKDKIRTQRLKNKLDDPNFLQSVTLKSLEKYHLVEYAKSLGRDVTPVSVNKISYEMSKTVNETIQKKVSSQLAKFDVEMKELMAEKRQQMLNFKQGMPITSGPFTLKVAVERMAHVDLYKPSTLGGHQNRLKDLVTRILKDDGSDLPGLFNDHEKVIKKIYKATFQNDSTKSYVGYDSFLNIPVTMYNNIPEFRNRLSRVSYLAYKAEYNDEKAKASDRLTELKLNTSYPEMIQLHIVRKYYANEYPGSLQHLISSLYTLSISVRNDYGCVRLITKENKVKNNGRFNYYDVEKGVFYLNSYKTATRYGALVYNFQKKLKDVIDLWLAKSGNKTYLITRNDYLIKQDVVPELGAGCAKTGHDGTMSTLISETFNFYMRKDDTEKSINLRTIRIIWATHLDKEKDTKKRSQLANMMGHSLEMARTVYVRATEGQDLEDNEELDKYSDYNEPNFPYTKEQILRGIDKIKK
jgi:hypothetical protein